mmetsp:Transcript_28379/g.46722  ORF Transcript_28379/g.46722 Transcript_28379/m.46722 type:complete len:569 (+) Transcript_28379:46-1752(+)
MMAAWFVVLSAQLLAEVAADNCSAETSSILQLHAQSQVTLPRWVLGAEGTAGSPGTWCEQVCRGAGGVCDPQTMKNTVGQDLVQAIQGIVPPVNLLNDQGPLGGYSGPGGTYAPFLRHDDSSLHRLRTGFDASALAAVDCAAAPDEGFIASRLCYCKFTDGTGHWGIAIGGGSGSPGRPCAFHCTIQHPGSACDPVTMKNTVGQALVQVILDLEAVLPATERFTLLNGLGGDPNPRNDFAPYLLFKAGTARVGFDASKLSSASCTRDANGDDLAARLCYCIPEGGGTGDPHIKTLHGAHYTLLRQGTFLAWSFAKEVSSTKFWDKKTRVDWRLLAAYGGSKFTTQGLLLSEKNLGQTMEFSAEDCKWRFLEGPGTWRVMDFKLHSRDSATAIQLHKKKSANAAAFSMMLYMKETHGLQKVANLITHCRPGHSLDWKLRMFRKEDVDLVGGELGVAPEKFHKSEYHFLSSKVSLMMRSDSDFEVRESWLALGGRAATDVFLRHQLAAQEGVAMVQTICGTEEERHAEETCGKYLQRDGLYAEVFADCVYDLCHGGQEEDVQAAAELLMM